MKNVIRLLALILLSSVTCFAHQVTLSCIASTSVVTGYNVYRSVNGVSYAKISSAPTCGYVDATVQGGTKYFYVMTAVASGVESVFSNAVTATVPEAPPSGLKGTVQD